MSELQQLQSSVAAAKVAYYAGKISLEQAWAVCDIYIEEFKRVKREKGLKVRVPNRHSLMR